MPRKDRPTEEEIREQMKLVGLDNWASSYPKPRST